MVVKYFTTENTIDAEEHFTVFPSLVFIGLFTN